MINCKESGSTERITILCALMKIPLGVNTLTIPINLPRLFKEDDDGQDAEKLVPYHQSVISRPTSECPVCPVWIQGFLSSISPRRKQTRTSVIHESHSPFFPLLGCRRKLSPRRTKVTVSAAAAAAVEIKKLYSQSMPIFSYPL